MSSTRSEQAARNVTSSSKPSRDLESFIALARPAKHFRALLRTESRDECSGSRYWTLVLSSRNWNFCVLLCIWWRISTCSETALRNYQQTLAFLIFRVGSKKICVSIILLLVRDNYMIDILMIDKNLLCKLLA